MYFISERLRMKNKTLIIVLSIIFVANIGISGDLSRLGTTSAPQLLVPVGARSIALGGAVLGSVTGAEAIYYNPAGIVKSEKSELLFSNMNYIADINMSYIAATFNGKEIGAFGFSVKSFDFGDIEETTTAYPDGTGNTYSPTFVTAGLSYSRLLIERISAGLTLKYIYEGIMQTSASAFALDLGIQYSFDRNLKMGVVMKNVGSKMKYDGRNMEYATRFPNATPDADNGYFRGVALESDIPSTFSVGVSYLFDLDESNLVNFSGTFVNQNDASDQFFGGVEYGYDNFLFLRGGYVYDANDADNQLFGASFGGGINYAVGEFEIQVDYAYRQLLDYFDANHIFTIKLGL
jgi:hypothetical protein